MLPVSKGMLQTMAMDRITEGKGRELEKESRAQSPRKHQLVMGEYKKRPQ